jgi:serine protease Do
MRLCKIENLLTAALLISAPINLFTYPSAAPPVSEQVSKDFTQVAKKAIPAVVSIQVKSKEAIVDTRSGGLGSGGLNENPYEDPFQDFFSDDFLEKFFGGGRRSRAQPQKKAILGQASGFIVSKDGYILTNNHVVKDAGGVQVTLNDGRDYDAKVVGQDPNTDLAVIKIEASDLPYLNLGNSDNLEVGQWVIAVGNPLGLQASLTVGVVSAKGRNNLDLVRIEDFIQTDAAINRGNSGGPLLNLEGEVVGINTAIISNMAYGYMGIGFAIPSNMAINVMDQLIHDGTVTRGYLGVVLQAVDKDLAQAFGLEKVEGALIAEIQKEGPAAKAGLKQGDIIMRYNTTKVNNIGSLRNAIAMMKPGSKIALTVQRNGKIFDIPVELSQLPSQEKILAGDDRHKLGFEVENLTPESMSTLGLVNETGVVVSKVLPGSPAAWLGLKKGAVILSVNQNKITNTNEFWKLIAETSENKPILLLIKQGEATRWVSIKVG